MYDFEKSFLTMSANWSPFPLESPVIYQSILKQFVQCVSVFLSSELKERLKPELLELIRQQRLNRLCQGTMFRKITQRRRQGEKHAQSPALKRQTVFSS